MAWDILDLCLWREARDESDDAIIAVACSIRNRVLTPYWWNWNTPGCYEAVILFPFAYSSFLSTDPNFKLAPKQGDPVLKRIQEITALIRNGVQFDTVSGAQSYFSGSQVPNWAAAMTHIVNVGAFHFYRS